jgi:hypothetical protein
MKKIIVSFFTLTSIFLCCWFLKSFFLISSPSGEFSSIVVKEGSKKCFFKRNDCNYQISIEELQKRTSFSWDYLLVFPNTLGYGEYGKSFLGRKAFFQAVNIVFVKDGVPVHEEYEEIEPDEDLIGSDLNLSKNQLQFEKKIGGFYYCPPTSSLIIKDIDSNNIFSSSLNGCKLIDSEMSEPSNLMDLINKAALIHE